MTQQLDIIAILPAGVLRTRAIDDGLYAAWAANGFQPLTQVQIEAVTGPAVAFPTVLGPDPDFPARGGF